MLTVQANKADAIAKAKKTLFFKLNSFKDAPSHVDDKYGIDVDDLYEIEEMLPSSQTLDYQIEIVESSQEHEDVIHLGYFKLSSL